MKRSPAIHAALAILCAASASGQSGAGAAAPLEWPKLVELRAVLTASTDYDQTLASVEALGPDVAPSIWALASGQVLIDLEVTGDQRAAIIAAFGEWSARSVVKSLSTAADAETPLDARLVLVDMLSALDHDSALPVVLEVLAEINPVQLSSNRVEATIDSALGQLLDGHPRRFQTLVSEMSGLPDGLLRHIVRTSGELHMSESTLVLTRAISMRRGLEADVLEQLSSRTYIAGQDTLLECAGMARGYLDDRDPKLRRHAAMALGRLGDDRSFDLLVDLLEDEDPTVRRVAQLALQELTGVRRTWTTERWNEWWTLESKWLAGEADDLADTLARGSAFDARQALKDLEQHPAFAARVADIAAYGLGHTDEHIRASACSTLARVGAAHGIESLIASLDDHSEEVRDAAHTALRGITSLDHGTQAFAWRAWWQTVR